MSPRRKLEPSTPEVDDVFDDDGDGPSRRWVLPVVVGAAAAVIVAALVGSVLLVREHNVYYRNEIQNVSVLSYVRQFMTQYTSPDPFNANGYTDAIQSQATGEFAEQYEAKKTETLVQIAMAQPTSGTVTEAGVENWNDDGSANVIVLTTISTTSADGKTPIESGIRWFVTAVREGDQWRISKLQEAL